MRKLKKRQPTKENNETAVCRGAWSNQCKNESDDLLEGLRRCRKNAFLPFTGANSLESLERAAYWLSRITIFSDCFELIFCRSQEMSFLVFAATVIKARSRRQSWTCAQDTAQCTRTPPVRTVHTHATSAHCAPHSACPQANSWDCSTMTLVCQ